MTLLTTVCQCQLVHFPPLVETVTTWAYRLSPRAMWNFIFLRSPPPWPKRISVYCRMGTTYWAVECSEIFDVDSKIHIRRQTDTSFLLRKTEENCPDANDKGEHRQGGGMTDCSQSTSLSAWVRPSMIMTTTTMIDELTSCFRPSRL